MTQKKVPNKEVTMHKLKDRDLMSELKKRFEEKDRALHDLRVATINLEKVNEKLQESEALKSNFLSNIRNEINNPLSSMIGMAKRLVSGKSLTKKDVSSMASVIYIEAFCLDLQLRNIFTAADIEAGETDLKLSSVNVTMLLQNVIDSFEQMIKEKKVSVTLKPGPPIKNEKGLLFSTDPEKLQLIFSNLLSNAIEFSHKKGTVAVKVGKEKGRLAIAVKDRGIGIRKADQDVIFDRFRQIDTGMRKSHRGHGLGLSIVKALVELLRGDISVSSARNKGSTFTFRIPESGKHEEMETFSEFGNVFLFSEELEGQRF